MARAQNAAGSVKSGIKKLQTGTEDNGESVLENELAAERESEWIDETEASNLSGMSWLAFESDCATRAFAGTCDR